MAATYSDTIAAGDNSGDITVTANAVFSVNTTQPVIVEAKNSGDSGASWGQIYRIETTDAALSFVAPSETIRISNEGTASARVEVFA